MLKLTNLEKRWTGQSDVELTEQGRQEAESIRPVLEKIPFDKVFSTEVKQSYSDDAKSDIFQQFHFFTCFICS